MTSFTSSLPSSGAPGSPCTGCGSDLAPDQRYCLRCGERRHDAVPDALDALRAAATPLLVAVAAGTAGPRRSMQWAVLPERSLRLAGAVFALTLGVAAYAGAAATSGGGSSAAPARYALAAPAAVAPVPAAPAEPAAPAAAAEVDPAPPGIDPGASTAAAADGATTPSQDDDAANDGAAEDEPAAPSPPRTDDEDESPAAPAPTLDHVILVALPPESYERRFDPAGPTPYLATSLPAAGALLSRVHALRPGTLATTIALVSGQGPNADTEAGCAAPTPVLPGTIGADDQAAGRGCVYPADAFTLGDQLSGRELTWRVYAAPEPAPAATPAACPPPGAPYAALRDPFLAFASVTTDAAACAARRAPAEQLASDLQRSETTPALAYVIAPADPAAIDPFLRALVAAYETSPAARSGALLITSEGAAPSDGSAPDTSACCSDRPWYADERAGGGRTGAVLLSRHVSGGTVIDAPLDSLDLLRTVSDVLGLRPLGLAAKPTVSGIPREAWSAWKAAATPQP